MSRRILPFTFPLRVETGIPAVPGPAAYVADIDGYAEVSLVGNAEFGDFEIDIFVEGADRHHYMLNPIRECDLDSRIRTWMHTDAMMRAQLEQAKTELLHQADTRPHFVAPRPEAV